MEYKNRNWLYQKYIIEHLGTYQISKLIGISYRTIHSWLVKFEIPRRKGGVDHWSEEQKEYRRQWNRLHPEIHRMKGRKHSIETKQKMSEKRKGSKNANWKGGLTLTKRGIKRSPEYYQWRKKVLGRDGNICQGCNKENSKEAHHIKSFKEFVGLRFDLNNGITLCQKCHKEIHFQRGVLSKKLQ